MLRLSLSTVTQISPKIEADCTRVIVNPRCSSTYGRIAPDAPDQAYCCLKIGYFTSCPPGNGRTQLIAELQESVSYGDSSAAEEEQTAMVQQA